jgi:cytochrome oxidase Cu insertion factor (SCO1/SenC/PrrC family)
VSARLKLALVFAVCAAPFVLGWAAWYFNWASGTTSNHGELIQPRPLSGPLEALRGKWVLVSLDAASCDAQCERKLYFMRQVRKAQGKEADRIERLWLLTDAKAPRPEVLTAIEGARVEALKNPAFAENFPGKPAEHIYLVDPLGNLMMRFPREPDPSKMIKDLQRLLKYSRIG